MNKPRLLYWCRQKLSWKADNWKSVEFIDKTQIVIEQDRKVEAAFGEGYTKSGILKVLRGSNSRNISPCSGVVFATKKWLLLCQLAEILTAVIM